MLKQDTDQHGHLIIITAFKSLGQRDVIFINEKNDLLPIVHVKKGGEGLQAGKQNRVGEGIAVLVKGNQMTVQIFFRFTQPVAFQ